MAHPVIQSDDISHNKRLPTKASTHNKVRTESNVILLTSTESNSNLATLSEKVATVIGVAETNGIGRFQCGFFMQKIQFYIIMSNWVGQSRDWLDSFVPVRQFCSVRLHNWRYVVGLKILQTEAIMPKSCAQKPLRTQDLIKPETTEPSGTAV